MLAAQAAPAATIDADDLLDWVEWAYPALFAGGSITLPIRYEGRDFSYRAYPGPRGDRQLGVTDDGRVFGLGDFTGGQLRGYGTLDDWSDGVRRDHCRVHPLASDCSRSGPPEQRLAVGQGEAMATIGSGRRLLRWGQQSDRTGSQPLAGIRRLSGGIASCAVDALGQVWAWQMFGTPLGMLYPLDGGVLDEGTPEPQQMFVPSRVVDADCGPNEPVVLRADGSLWVRPGPMVPYGAGYRVHTALRLTGLPAMRRLGVASVQARALAVDAQGHLWQVVGAPSHNEPSAPVLAQPVPGLPAIETSVCETVCLILSEDGRVWSWAPWAPSGAAPTPVDGLPAVAQVLTFDEVLLALDRSGQVWSWGRGPLGRAGDGAAVERPTPVPGLGDVLELAGHAGVVLVRRGDGSVWGWGDNRARVLGEDRPTFIPIREPVRVNVPGLDLR